MQAFYHIQGSDLPGRGWNGTRVGSETCVKLLPSGNTMEKLSTGGDSTRLSLVTPIAGPGEVSTVQDLIKTARSLGWGEVVINDWGVLAQAGRTRGPEVTAGRLLMRFRRGPGFYDPWDEMDPASRRYFAWGPLYDSPFLVFLRRKGVTRIELDPPRHWMAPPPVKGFRFSFHLNTRLISVSAACPWLYDNERHQWGPMAGCTEDCARHGGLRMAAPALDKPLFLRDRAILEDPGLNLEDLDLPDLVDRIIYDRIRDSGTGNERRYGRMKGEG